MPFLRISDPQHETCAQYEQLSTVLHHGKQAFPVYFRAYGVPVASGIEPFVPISLLPAMLQQIPLHASQPISRRFHGQLGLIQQTMQAGDPQCRIIAVHISPAEPTAIPPAAGVGVFFSCGVDSFYTLLQKRTEITDLIYVHGFDIPLENVRAHQAAVSNAARVAQHFGKRLIHVETNVHCFVDRFGGWATHMFGPALAAVAHLLSPQLGRVWINGECVSTLPHASRPELDPLWSSEAVDIDNFGHAQTRFQKLTTMAGQEIVQSCLRVCWQNQDGLMNCGVCSKCLRNLAILRALGVLDRMSTFPVPFDLHRLARLELDRNWPYLPDTMSEILQFVEAKGSDPELAQALRECLQQRRYRGLRGFARRGWRKLRRFLITWRHRQVSPVR